MPPVTVTAASIVPYVVATYAYPPLPVPGNHAWATPAAISVLRLERSDAPRE